MADHHGETRNITPFRMASQLMGCPPHTHHPPGPPLQFTSGQAGLSPQLPGSYMSQEPSQHAQESGHDYPQQIKPRGRGPPPPVMHIMASTDAPFPLSCPHLLAESHHTQLQGNDIVFNLHHSFSPTAKGNLQYL